VENVTDRTSNPFGMTLPCDEACAPGGPVAVHGYGDANADFHVVGDHPGVHGGRGTGVPFTESVAGERLQGVLHEVGLLADAYSDEPTVRDCFLSYLHACCPSDRGPTDDDYRRLEPFFDAELRAITAHVLVPVGERATAHVLRTYTSRARLLDRGMAWLHARELHGAGFLVVPVRDPAEWDDGDREVLVEELGDVVASDYRQITDLGRFTGLDGDPYLVR
jgi:uracil-DNA glycosylase family 4